jgi:hypothetical protein
MAGSANRRSRPRGVLGRLDVASLPDQNGTWVNEGGAGSRPLSLLLVGNDGSISGSGRQSTTPEGQELPRREARKIGHRFARHLLEGLRMVEAEILHQVVRGIAVTLAVPDHDNSAAGREGFGDALVEARVFRRPLAALGRLVLMREVVEEIVRIVRSDHIVRRVGGSDIQMV